MRRLTSLLLLVPSLLSGESQAITPGTIIVLNGPSAAGKTTIQQEFQKLSREPYLKAGIDTFFDALIAVPDLSNFEKTKSFSQYTNDGELIRSVKLTKDAKGNQIVPLTIGPAGDRIISGMHYAIAAYANRGNNMIVDYILYEPRWLPDLVQSLKNQKVYFIGIKVPLEVLEAREKRRGTSPVGHARSHYDTVHKDMVYDLEIDFSDMTPQQCAIMIQEFIQQNPTPTAIKKLSDPALNPK